MQTGAQNGWSTGEEALSAVPARVGVEPSVVEQEAVAWGRFLELNASGGVGRQASSHHMTTQGPQRAIDQPCVIKCRNQGSAHKEGEKLQCKMWVYADTVVS